MKQKFNWLNYLAELIVVFLGITAAFMLEGWRQGYQDRQLEQKYYQSFYSDLHSDSEVLKNIIPPNQLKLKRIQFFLMDDGEHRSDSVKAILSDMMKIELFDRKQSTYESIKNSGNLNVISSYDLKEELIRYYESFKMVERTESLYLDWLSDYAIPFIYENMDIKNQRLIATKKLKDHHLNNTVAGYYALLNQNIETYYQILAKNDSLISKISLKMK
jgi:hypothetical protein